jgi:hypothetical protein
MRKLKDWLYTNPRGRALNSVLMAAYVGDVYALLVAIVRWK